VVFQLKEPFNAFLMSLMASSAPMMPAHIYEGSDFRTNPFNVKPIGTGPFKFAQWKRGQFIHLTRNEHYWRPGQPGMDGIYYRVCPTPEQRMVAMETGAVDLAMADDIDTVVNSRMLANPNIVARADAYNGTGEITVMELNMRRWPFGDRRFRAAFLHAIDREFLVKGGAQSDPVHRALSRRQGADEIRIQSCKGARPVGRNGAQDEAWRRAAPFRHHAGA
jgi:peptide/nickel transport system substrate-binding protein